MKTFSYLIDGDITPEIINQIKAKIEENAPKGVSLSFTEKPATIHAVIDTKNSELRQSNVEDILTSIVDEIGLTLVLPANTKRFSFVGDATVKAERLHSTKTLVMAIAITLVASVLFTYIFASGILKIPFLGNTPESNVIDISDATDQVKVLNKLFSQLQYDYGKLDTDVLTDYLLKAYVEATGDQYAVYYNAEEYEAWKNSQKGTSVGIGITVTQSKITVDSKEITVIEVLYVNELSPAKAAGIKIGDCIYAVGKEATYKEVNDIGYDKACDLLLGEVGTVADVSVYRKTASGDFESKSFSITRAIYESDTVFGSVCETNDKVGVIKLLSFGTKTPKQFSTVVDELRSLGCEYFIFDLRSNPGGDLNSIRAILSYFLNPGDLIISIEYSDGTKTEHAALPVEYDEDDVYYDCTVTVDDIGKYKGLKFNVLTDQNTASAAELFTATVRDYGLGKIIGESRTYGKGCMQSIIPLTSYGLEGGLRVTTSMYFSKSHTVYHDKGIVPDIIEPLNSEAKKYNIYSLPHAKDNQLQMAISELTK